MQTVTLAQNIYVSLDAERSNAGFCVGKEGVLCIDAKSTHEEGVAFRGQIHWVTQAPVIRMLLTHSGFGHVGGLSAFRRIMTVTAHAAAKKDMELACRAHAKDVLNDYLPDETFEQSLDFDFQGTAVKMLHFGPAHSAGDAVVFFKKEKLVFAGDLLVLSANPLVHFKQGGSALGLHDALKGLLKLDAEVFVPGHGATCGRKEVEGLLSVVDQKLDMVESMVKRGKSLPDVKEMLDPSLSGGGTYASFEEVVFRQY